MWQYSTQEGCFPCGAGHVVENISRKMQDNKKNLPIAEEVPEKREEKSYFCASSTATATATVAPTMGLLPMPIRPIISTCAGTEEEPAN